MTTIRRLEYFISVANNLSFTKAADECFVAETAISQNIAKLEEEIGFKLFERNNRKVKLTPAGEAFFKEAKFIVDRYKKAVRDCKAIALKSNSILKIGFVSQFERPVVTEFLKEFISFYPNIQIIITQYSYKMLINFLKNGELDVAFLSPINPEHISELEIKQISIETYCAAMCKSHPLATKRKLTANMLKNEKIILLTPVWELPYNIEWTRKICKEFGLKEENIIPCTGKPPNYKKIPV